MTPEQDMENVAVLAERYAEILAEKIERLIPHINDGTHVTGTAREAVNNAVFVAEAALERLRDTAAKAREARNSGREAA